MPRPINPAILRALTTHLSNSNSVSTSTPIDETTITLHPHGSSSFTSTSRLFIPAINQSFFLKTSTAHDAKVMFKGEFTSLSAIHAAVASLCPTPIAWGCSDPPPNTSRESNQEWFLITDFLTFTHRRSLTTQGNKTRALASKLATLHRTPAPIPQGYTTPQFGFPVPTCCGRTVQPNPFTKSWAEFFGRHRLLAILAAIEKTQGTRGNEELRNVIERIVHEVIPFLLADNRLGGVNGTDSVVVHGDLWSGNHGVALYPREDGKEGGREEHVTFDPSSCYAHHEYEHGIMRMFGGFDAGFWREYFAVLPRTEPAGEYEDRVKVYESYHHLNHYAMFGGGYKGGAMALLKPLLEKYARDVNA